MTLLFIDGCKSGEALKYDSASYGATSQAGGRFGGGAYSNTVNLTKGVAASAMVGVAVAMLPSAGQMVIQLSGDAGATIHLTVQRNLTSGLMEVRRGATGGTLLATGTASIPTGVWTHVEVQATVADAGGTVKVRLNGSATADIDFTGDTKNAGTNTTIDRVYLNASSAGAFVSDVAIYNGLGAVNNDWLGDCRVVVLSPSGNGATSQGVNSGGTSTNNYTAVDELPFSSTDYVGVTTAGQGDTYAMTDLPAGVTTVKGVQFHGSVAKSDAGAKSVKRRIRSGSTTYAGAAQVLSASYVPLLEVLEADPATSTAWTPSGVNGVEAGFEAA